MKNIQIEEKILPVEKKLVALEMSKDMWKKIRFMAVEKDITFSAMVRLMISKYLYENDAKLNEMCSRKETTNE